MTDEREATPPPGDLPDVSPELPEEVEDLAVLADLIDADPDQVLAVLQASWRGPLPPPAALAAYEEIVPGSAKQMMDAVQTQGSHRRAMEKEHADAAIRRASRGQWWAGFLSALLIVAGFILVMNDHDWAGGTIITGTVVGLATVFLVGRRQEPPT